jgi:uncharacterized membrane protein YeaQ/YmgE (transglycosylase-associated protein family)
MGYKVLGYIVWQVAKMVVKYKTPRAVTPRNVGIAGLVAVGIVGALVATRSSDDS